MAGVQVRESEDPDQCAQLDGVTAIALFGVGMFIALAVLAMFAG